MVYRREKRCLCFQTEQEYSMMILEKVKSEGLAHLSYIMGDGDEAIVIDPRRDCEIYLDIAAR